MQLKDTTKRLLAQVLAKITPTPAERVAMENVIHKTTAAIEPMLKPQKLSYTLAGSFIRDTWMRDKKEFEIFIMFPEDTPRDVLEREGLELGKSLVEKMSGSYRIAYAEHPYVRGNIIGFDVDLVPCYKLDSPLHIKTAVDRTPFHNKWIAINLKPRQSGEVRLLKQFAKAHGFYGSDTKTQGLSGYLCELLIIHYGSFMGFLEAAAGWKPGEVLIDSHNSRPEDTLLKKRFKDQPLIVIDPVDHERNVAAVLSPENFSKITRLASEFLERPSSSFFFPPKIKIDIKILSKLMSSRDTKILVVRLARPDIIDDVLWPQLRRTAQRLRSILEEYEFDVLGHDVLADGECSILIELEVWKLPKIRKLRGPGVFAKERVTEFRNKYEKLGKVWVENDAWVAQVPRTFTQASDKLSDSLSDKEHDLLAKGIASYIANSIASHGFDLLEGQGIIDYASKNNGFGVFLRNYLMKGE
jgi:tRNA nucleotidyltransferase (CCA-adding enzyme)